MAQMTKAEIDAQIAALEAQKEQLDAMTPEERAAHEQRQREAQEKRRIEEVRKKEELDRVIFHAINFPLAVLLVWASNQDWLPLGAFSWATYSNGGVALVGLLWYVTDRFFFKGFNIYDLAREKWQVAVLLACSYMFTATIGMLGGLGHIYLGGSGGYSAGVPAGSSSRAGGNTFVFQFGNGRSDTVRTGGSASMPDRQLSNGARGGQNGAPARPKDSGGSER